MGIVLNEREYALEALRRCELGVKPADTLRCVAKYYRAEGYHKAEIHERLEVFLQKCDPGINLVKWQDTVARYVKDAERYPLLEIEGVPITRRELEICGGLTGKQMPRLLFTLLCLAKYSDMASEKNNGWVNRSDREIFSMANIVTPTRRKSLMLNDLRGAGLIRFSRKVDNVNINVSCIDKEGEAEMVITDYRNLGYQYLMRCGEPYFECAECGIMVRRANNAQKYCKGCALEVNIQKTMENQRNAMAV